MLFWWHSCPLCCYCQLTGSITTLPRYWQDTVRNPLGTSKDSRHKRQFTGNQFQAILRLITFTLSSWYNFVGNKQSFLQVRANPPIRLAECNGDIKLYCTANITTWVLCVLCHVSSLFEDKYFVTRALVEIQSASLDMGRRSTMFSRFHSHLLGNHCMFYRSAPSACSVGGCLYEYTNCHVWHVLNSFAFSFENAFQCTCISSINKCF